MTIKFHFSATIGALLLSLFTASVACAAYADPPGRVARLEHTQGAVSYSPAGEDEWIGVARNRPLVRGDRLWTDRDARAEFQVGSAAVRLGSNTSIEILDLGDRVAQIRMTQGTLNLSVRRIHPGQTYEVATPLLAFSINRAGRYRIDVDPRNAVTTIVVREGDGEAYGDNSNFQVRAGDTVRFYDSDLRDYDMYGLPREDDFDRYCLDRDQRLARSASLRYIDDDVVGYADLDEYGTWRQENRYGNVWFPSRVAADWAPYRDGHWVWQEPWGWTWVDDAPWGFAPSHYGRWVNVSNRWGWVPGPRNVRPVYAPALVAFVGGSGWNVSISLGGGSAIGWFPLGPREVYVPSYQASRDYFNRVNVNNTVINNTTITNVYNNYSGGTAKVDHGTHANRAVAGAVTAIPRSVFVNAEPVRPAAIRLDREALTTGEITRVAPIAPSVRSVIGSAKTAEARPSRETSDRQVVVRNPPPPAESPFAAREQQLQKHPGLAPEAGASKSMPSSSDKPAQKVRVISEQRSAVDARSAGSLRTTDKPATPAAAPTPLQPLDRSVEPAKEPAPAPSDRGRDKVQKTPGEAQQDGQSKLKAASDQKSAEQQKAEQQRQGEALQQQQAAKKQQAERQRQEQVQQEEQRQSKSVSDQKATGQQKAEQQRKVEVQQQQQAAKKQQAERQRQEQVQQEEQRQSKSVSDQKSAEQQKAEQQRQGEALQQQQAAKKQQAERQRQEQVQQEEQLQRKSVSDQKATGQQKAEQQRKVEVQQQQQAAEQKKVGPQRQSEGNNKPKVIEQQKAGRQPQGEAEQQQQPTEKQQVERKRQADAQRQAECERQAIQQHQDVSQCRSETPPQASPGNQKQDKGRRQ